MMRKKERMKMDREEMIRIQEIDELGEVIYDFVQNLRQLSNNLNIKIDDRFIKIIMKTIIQGFKTDDFDVIRIRKSISEILDGKE